MHTGICPGWNQREYSKYISTYMPMQDIIKKLWSKAKPSIQDLHFIAFCQLQIWSLDENIQPNFTYLIRGLIPVSLVDFISQHKKGDGTSLSIISSLHTTARDLFQKHIWLPRCAKFKQKCVSLKININQNSLSYVNSHSNSNSQLPYETTDYKPWIHNSIQYGSHWANFQDVTDSDLILYIEFILFYF